MPQQEASLSKKVSRKCIYAGSFDPITSGHFWMIQEGARLFDELVVAVGVNPDKRSNYPLELRLEMIRNVLRGMPHVSVASFSGQFLVEFAAAQGADFILRGIRGETDFEYERGMRYINDKINSNVSTVFLVPPKTLSETSSSLVRGLIGPPGWTHIVKQFVPDGVFDPLLDYELRRQWNVYVAPVLGIEQNIFEEIQHLLSSGSFPVAGRSLLAERLAELQTLRISKDDIEHLATAIWLSHLSFERAQEILGTVDKKVSASILDCLKNTHSSSIKGSLVQYFADIQCAFWGYERERFEYFRSLGSCKGMLGHGNGKIFRTDEFGQRYEARARENLGLG